MVVKYPGRSPLNSMVPLFSKEVEILVQTMPLALNMKSLIANLQEVITSSTALTHMETDGTEPLLPSKVKPSAVDSLAEPELTQVDFGPMTFLCDHSKKSQKFEI